MRSIGRIKLFCSKKLHSGIYDRFTVIVSEDKKDAAKKEYKRQGYTVR